MTLSERVRRAGYAEKPAQESDGALLRVLREQVQEYISVDDLAQIASENTRRARNELRSACRRAFEDSFWAAVDDTVRAQLVSQVLDAVFGFGVIDDLIADESITEIIVNGPKKVFVERGGRLIKTERTFASVSDVRVLIDRILGPLGRRIDEASPMVNARLPQGHRVNVVVAPIALEGPYITIRKFTNHVITLDEMVASKSIELQVKTFLVWAIRARKSIAVVGGTGSGKTTLLNALSCEISHDERIITIEDSAELRFKEHPHVVRLEARPVNAEGVGEVTIRDLVINALRMRPDRIIVGECRGAEALDMLQAMNTGHDGSLTTLHANSPEESISRLTTMVRYEADLPVDVIEANIATAIDIVVQMRRDAQGMRSVSDVVAFSFDRRERRCAARQIYARPPGEEKGEWRFSPEWIDDMCRQGLADGEEVEQWKQECSLQR